MNLPVRVVKVGGSLFALPDLAARLQIWLAAQAPAVNVLLAGGGRLADAVRDWDQRFDLGQDQSHWLCVDLLDVTTRFISCLLPGSIVCDDWELPIRHSRDISQTICLLPSRFLRTAENRLPGPKLPYSWDVSSDSIAARLADALNASELVLLKSRLPDSAMTIGEMAGDYVDAWFPHAARCHEVIRFVDLKHGLLLESVLRPS